MHFLTLFNYRLALPIFCRITLATIKMNVSGKFAGSIKTTSGLRKTRRRVGALSFHSDNFPLLSLTNVSCSYAIGYKNYKKNDLKKRRPGPLIHLTDYSKMVNLLPAAEGELEERKERDAGRQMK